MMNKLGMFVGLMFLLMTALAEPILIGHLLSVCARRLGKDGWI